MSAYTSERILAASLPQQFLTQALDDDGDQVADAGLLDTLIESVSLEIDGTLGQRYSVPFAEPLPPLVAHAAKVLTLDELYRRRGFDSANNPWADLARNLRQRLSAVARGEEPLRPGERQGSPSVLPITKPAKTHGCHTSL